MVTNVDADTLDVLPGDIVFHAVYQNSFAAHNILTDVETLRLFDYVVYGIGLVVKPPTAYKNYQCTMLLLYEIWYSKYLSRTNSRSKIRTWNFDTMKLKKINDRRAWICLQ